MTTGLHKHFLLIRLLTPIIPRQTTIVPGQDDSAETQPDLPPNLVPNDLGVTGPVAAGLRLDCGILTIE